MKARASLQAGGRVDGISANKTEDIDEATIGYAPLILYPSNWDQITRRVDTLDAESAWRITRKDRQNQNLHVDEIIDYQVNPWWSPVLNTKDKLEGSLYSRGKVTDDVHAVLNYMPTAKTVAGMKGDATTAEIEQLRKDVEDLRGKLRSATQGQNDNSVNRSLDSKYGRSATVTTRNGQLTIGGLEQVWYYTDAQSPKSVLFPIGGGAGMPSLDSVIGHSPEETYSPYVASESSAQSAVHFAAGKRLAESFEYEEARKELEQAVQFDRTNETYRRELVQVNDVLGVRRDRIKSAISDLYGEHRVAVQEKLVELDNRIDWGQRFSAQAQHDPELSPPIASAVISRRN